VKKATILLAMLCLTAIPSCAANRPAAAQSKSRGAASQGPSHSVTLTWKASTSREVTGYNVYRSQKRGGPYTQLNRTIISGTSYADKGVSAGQTYYYVVRAVGRETAVSNYSNEASATVPAP
jgi:fibronectin type 3 domain-containing protein